MNFRPITAGETSVRVSQVAKDGTWITALIYKDARVDANILDETVKPENWQCRFYECKGNLFCSVGIRDSFDSWVWKDDAGAESKTEAEKGEASDAFKRACFKWGIGRELYTAPLIFIKQKGPDGKDNYDMEGGKPKLNLVCTFLGVQGGKITGINIENSKKRRTVFSWGDLGL